MANPEHIEILKQGVGVWNEWRKNVLEHDYDNYGNVELYGADLAGANLEGVNLAHARLTEANLAGANLDNATLTFAEFLGATLEGASMRKCHLTDTNFFGAYLSDADLSDSNLVGTMFVNADLEGAILTYALLGDTVFGNTNLLNARGLESCKYFMPSVIDFRTLERSGNLPLNFLRGCGLSDTSINNLPLLLNSPTQFYSCFISYSSRDKDFAERLYTDLQNQGVRCWFAPEDLKIGDKIRDRIDESIRLRDKLLLILTENSIMSDWVEHEVESALEEERQKGRTILFPIRLDDAVVESSKAWAALIRRTRHIGDFTRWKEPNSYQKAFERLLRDLKAGR